MCLVKLYNKYVYQYHFVWQIKFSKRNLLSNYLKGRVFERLGSK